MIYQISQPQTKYVGDVWSAVIPLTSKSGGLTVSAVSNYLYAEESTSDVLSTYSSGAVDYEGNNIICPLVGIGSGSTNILPGKYTYMVQVTYNGGLVDTLKQELEFLERKG